MACIARKVLPLHRLHSSKAKWVSSMQIVRNHWNKDWKPDSYPETREFKEKAAKKYGISPETYKAYPEDGLGYGDYPCLPDVSNDRKDPYYPYDFPEHKKNFGEPWHTEADMYGEDRIIIDDKPKYSGLSQLGTFLSVIGGSFLLYFLFENAPMAPPVMPKQLYEPAVVRYTYESK